MPRWVSVVLQACYMGSAAGDATDRAAARACGSLRALGPYPATKASSVLGERHPGNACAECTSIERRRVRPTLPPGQSITRMIKYPGSASPRPPAGDGPGSSTNSRRGVQHRSRPRDRRSLRALGRPASRRRPRRAPGAVELSGWPLPPCCPTLPPPGWLSDALGFLAISSSRSTGRRAARRGNAARCSNAPAGTGFPDDSAARSGVGPQEGSHHRGGGPLTVPRPVHSV